MRIEVRVRELRQLFNAMDPSPFREKDLDPSAEAFIVDWARESPRDAPLSLLVRLDRPAGIPHEAAAPGDAVREYFARRAVATRWRLRLLFRRGRVSLLIGVAVLAASLALGDLVASALAGRRVGELLRESLLVPVRLAYETGGKPDAKADAWRSDWPVVPPGKQAPPHDSQR